MSRSCGRGAEVLLVIRCPGGGADGNVLAHSESLHDCVDLGAHQDGQARQVQPEDEDRDAGEGTLGRSERPELRRVEREAQRHQRPRQRRDHGTRTRPTPPGSAIGREKVEHRQQQVHEDQRHHPTKGVPRGREDATGDRRHVAQQSAQRRAEHRQSGGHTSEDHRAGQQRKGDEATGEERAVRRQAEGHIQALLHHHHPRRRAPHCDDARHHRGGETFTRVSLGVRERLGQDGGRARRQRHRHAVDERDDDVMRDRHE